LLIDREIAQILAIFCRVCERLRRAQVVWHSKVEGLEHPSLEITKAIFAVSDKAVGSKGRQDA
jgi:hypothetical protein